jgi:hypothetical protein
VLRSSDAPTSQVMMGNCFGTSTLSGTTAGSQSGTMFMGCNCYYLMVRLLVIMTPDMLIQSNEEAPINHE